jgi:hypothetical protein
MSTKKNARVKPCAPCQHQPDAQQPDPAARLQANTGEQHPEASARKERHCRETPPCIRVAACLVSCPRAVPAHLRERRLQFDPKPLVLPPEGEVLKAKVTDRAGGTRLA